MSKGIIEVRRIPNDFKIFQIVGITSKGDEDKEREGEDLLCAVSVDNVEEKMNLLKALLEHCSISDTNCYFFNENVIIKLLKTWTSSYQRNVVKNPKPAKPVKEKPVIPDGTYYLSRKVRGFGVVQGTLAVKDGRLIVKSGSTCAPFAPLYSNKKIQKLRDKYMNSYNVIMKDCECSSVSTAATLLVGNASGGYNEWKNSDGVNLGELIGRFSTKKAEKPVQICIEQLEI